MNVFNTDGWSKPIYTDDWGNVISSEDKERMDRSAEVKRMIYEAMLKAKKAEEAVSELKKMEYRVKVRWTCGSCGAFGCGYQYDCPVCHSKIDQTVEKVEE